MSLYDGLMKIIGKVYAVCPFYGEKRSSRQQPPTPQVWGAVKQQAASAVLFSAPTAGGLESSRSLGAGSKQWEEIAVGSHAYPWLMPLQV